MKVLIVDNKDSFTYNLKNYISQFCSDVDVLRYNRIQIGSVYHYDKVLLSPGPGLPGDYPILSDILAEYASHKSIFGVCLGGQAIGEFYGCSLKNLSYPLHGVTSRIKHFNNCILYEDIPSSFCVGHYHSWVVSNKDIPSELEITSVNENGLIMSIKHKLFDVRGIQFHPESILTEHGLLLIKNWLLN